MCGIAGFYKFQEKQNLKENLHIAHNMEGGIMHRGPDSGDIWQDDDINLTFIHRRLAIIDLSADGAQPMRSPSGRFVVTFNGEIYNYLELRRDLEVRGVSFRGASDTEVMLAGFDQWGVEATLKKLNGMFAFALYDVREKYLHFVRDRFGKKPLYMGWVDGALVFASELKTFHAYPNFQKNLNQDALAIYMKYGYVHAPYSIFENIWQLLPSSMLSLDVKNIAVGENLASRMKSYWPLKSVAQEGRSNLVKKSDDLIVDEFEEKLGKAVQQRMISDVPLGAFLSGGIDSSVVVSLMQKNSKTPVKTFTAGFEQEGFNEAGYAKEVAQHLGTDHHEFYCSDQDALNVIPSLAQIYDEPFADQSQIPTYLISKLAREHATVVLTGDGGDEILAGYDRHTKIAPLWDKVSVMPQSLRRAICSSLDMLPEEFYQKLRSNHPNFGTQVKRVLHLMGLKDTDAVYDYLVSGWSGGEAAVLQGALPIDMPLNDKNGMPEGLSFLDQMIFKDTLSYRSNDLMVKTDRASMAVALEARAPLMDHELAEYSWRLPAHLKLRGGKGKWILREVLKKHVPEELYERPKMGFSVPLNSWLKGSLNEWANDLLDPARLKAQGLMDVNLVTDRWENFQEDQSLQASRKDLWSILMFQSWYDEWMK